MSFAFILLALALVIVSVLRLDHFKAVWRAITKSTRKRDRVG
jgi:hypothetical protein